MLHLSMAFQNGSNQWVRRELYKHRPAILSENELSGEELPRPVGLQVVPRGLALPVGDLLQSLARRRVREGQEARDETGRSEELIHRGLAGSECLVLCKVLDRDGHWVQVEEGFEVAIGFVRHALEVPTVLRGAGGSAAARQDVEHPRHDLAVHAPEVHQQRRYDLLNHLELPLLPVGAHSARLADHLAQLLERLGLAHSVARVRVSLQQVLLLRALAW
mmetsp:Transcript_75083/g.220006  ORF Transcript_75083/g.220006 Transcript_75083/m.220006 type:complete len:219 (+) Transcript_75083:210-866(+)